jgi:glycosyltransferase involved in cell wall biosynthesis
MKVLFDHPTPFALAHGGLQIQIIQTRKALEKLGVEVEFLRWWDGYQAGDILHYFGRPGTDWLRLAQGKGMKVVLADLLTAQGSRPQWKINLQKTVRRFLETRLLRGSGGSRSWESYRLADACVALTRWEARLLEELFGAQPRKIHVVPNGVEEVFLEQLPAVRGSWLVCTATITERKRILELAEAAARAQTPMWIIGKPYSESDPYARSVLAVCRQNPSILRYEGAIEDRAKLAQVYREARGFVLLSAMESLSLSALEAAACECPLLLSDLPWARTAFGSNASYCPINGSTHSTAKALRKFHDNAPGMKPPPKPVTWIEVGSQLKQLYETLLKPSTAEPSQSPPQRP